jgi:hypothetical protein
VNPVARSGALVLAGLIAAGCVAPMTQREAVQIATERMGKYCGASARCKPLRLSHTQKIKDRWLVEFDTPATSYGVAVAGDGNTEISIWDKSSGVSVR